MERVKLQKALISVSDKHGLAELCRSLHKRGVRLYATGGTATFLEKQGLPCEKVEALTQFPEMMDGRVKTLHPRIFGGVLARRENPKDMEEAARFEVPLFDLLVVNLYPFAEHLNEPPEAQSAFVDIGGPSLVRAAAKNFAWVTILSDPADYSGFLAEMESQDGATTRAYRHGLAARAFQRTSRYDAMIAEAWSRESALPATLSLLPQEPLRYGENPHQKAAWCGTRAWSVLQGKELSFNNLLDAEAALRIVGDLDQTSVAIVKHNNPCGVATGKASVASLFERAFQADNKSAFGGIVAVNAEVDATAAEAMQPIFLEVVVARRFSPEALAIFEKKKNLRLITWEKPTILPVDVRGAMGGWLVQEIDRAGAPKLQPVAGTPQVATGLEGDLKFAWLVCKHVRSNAIVVAAKGVTLGIGAGQMSRVDAVNVALQKCGSHSLKGAVLASDAFFPFRDNVDLLKGKGIAAIIQPGGSQRDAEVIEACEEHGIAMVFTGERHFRH